MSENMTTEKLVGVTKKYAFELDAMSIADHTAIVNILLQLCQRRQIVRVDEINANAERAESEVSGRPAPHLIARPS